MAYVLDAEGQHDAAIAESKEALRLKPDLAAAHDTLACALDAEGQHDAAIAQFKEAIRLNRDFSGAH